MFNFLKKLIMGNNININGKIYENGNSIVIKNNNIWIDGKNVTPDSKIVTIDIKGNINSIECDIVEKITVNGNVENNLKTTNGDIEVGGFVAGSVTTNGDVTCNNVSGNVKTTNGDIKYKK